MARRAKPINCGLAKCGLKSGLRRRCGRRVRTIAPQTTISKPAVVQIHIDSASIIASSAKAAVRSCGAS